MQNEYIINFDYDYNSLPSELITLLASFLTLKERADLRAVNKKTKKAVDVSLCHGFSLWSTQGSKHVAKFKELRAIHLPFRKKLNEYDLLLATKANEVTSLEKREVSYLYWSRLLVATEIIVSLLGIILPLAINPFSTYSTWIVYSSICFLLLSLSSTSIALSKYLKLLEDKTNNLTQEIASLEAKRKVFLDQYKVAIEAIRIENDDASDTLRTHRMV